MKTTSKPRGILDRIDDFSKRADCRNEISRCERAIELYTRLSILYEIRGMSFAKQGLYDEATEAWAESIEFENKLADIYCSRGTAYYLLGEYGRALSDFNKTLEINCDNSYALHNRGCVYLKLGKFNEAEKDLLRARELNPEFATYHKAHDLSFHP